jgi:hypothetical protein
VTWLFDWSACIFAGCLGHGWRTPKGWIAHKAEMVRQEAAWRKIEERARELRVQQALADVPPIVYHRDTPSKNKIWRLPHFKNKFQDSNSRIQP